MFNPRYTPVTNTSPFVRNEYHGRIISYLTGQILSDLNITQK